ncbi:MAG: SIR2 family protein [Methanobrevibacter sp.]|jgi:hypothetical protein|nr:SIR2 family protein [Candidatus Methanoflexus mossambicus]
MIEDSPEIPKGIKTALRKNNLVVFLGAGVSRLLGCASWEELAKNLVDCCYETEIDGKKLIPLRVKEILCSGNNYKKTISICKNILKDNEKKDKFYKVIEESLEAKDSSKKIKIYEELKKLIYSAYPDNEGFFITTNIDTHFTDKFNENNVVYNPINNKVPMRELKLYHLHGSLKDRDSIVLTVDNYIKTYGTKEIKNFLGRTFRNFVVLFIGYGLTELEVLDFLLTEFKHSDGETKHFILLPYRKNEMNMQEYDQLYYKDLGINVIGYSKENGYEQLYEVIKNWNKEIAQEPKDMVKEISDFKEEIGRINKRTI